MFWSGNRINAVIIKGSKIKSLLNKNRGVLVYKNNELFFVPFDDPIKLVIPNLSQKAEEKIVFISEEFDKVSKLNDDEEYLLVFRDTGELQVWDKKYQDMKLLMYGITI